MVKPLILLLQKHEFKIETGFSIGTSNIRTM